MKYIALIALICISTTLAIIPTQLACITKCKADGLAAANKDAADLIKYTADGVREASIIATKTCVYPTVADSASKYCDFATCYKKAYTVTSNAAKN